MFRKLPCGVGVNARRMRPLSAGIFAAQLGACWVVGGSCRHRARARAVAQSSVFEILRPAGDEVVLR